MKTGKNIEKFCWFVVVFLIFAASICVLPGTIFAQTAPIPFHMVSYNSSSGPFEGSQILTTSASSEVIRVAGAPWLQLNFSQYNLGTKSYITIISLEDGGQQRLDGKSILNWSGSTAYFNGEAVEVKLFVDQSENGIFYTISTITAGERSSAVTESQCGTTDNRVSSTDTREGRIMPVGCTGWIVSNGANLTAGHCTRNKLMNTLQFNVPASDPDGTINNPPPQDQYPIDNTSITFVDGGSGNDWAVFNTFANADTGLMAVEVQNNFFRMTRDSNPVAVRITGYGVDSNPSGTTGGRNSDNQTLQTHSGTSLGEVVQSPSDIYIEYTVDTEGGNSGSPVFDVVSGLSVGIHTHGGCNPPDFGNKGTSFENDGLEQALQVAPGFNMIYVDKGYSGPIKDGTVLRPWGLVSSGINLAQPGDTVSIVRGTYNENITINKAATLTAPVGAVTIGQ